MTKYICYSKGKIISNGEKEFHTGERALYYNMNLHRRRIYRSGFPVAFYPSLRLFIYKNKKTAQRLCDLVNEKYGDNFEPKEIEV